MRASQLKVGRASGVGHGVPASKPVPTLFKTPDERAGATPPLTAAGSGALAGLPDPMVELLWPGACLLAVTLGAEHRAGAELYLAAHPEVRELLVLESAEPEPGEPKDQQLRAGCSSVQGVLLRSIDPLPTGTPAPSLELSSWSSWRPDRRPVAARRGRGTSGQAVHAPA